MQMNEAVIGSGLLTNNELDVVGVYPNPQSPNP